MGYEEQQLNEWFSSVPHKPLKQNQDDIKKTVELIKDQSIKELFVPRVTPSP